MRGFCTKTLAGTILSAMLMLTPAFLAGGQDYDSTPVSVSKEKVRVNGKVFLSHVVLERQTLYSISKAYQIGIDDIYRYNPSLKENGLKKNSIILIPTQETLVQVKAEESPSQRQRSLDSLTAPATAADSDVARDSGQKKHEAKSAEAKKGKKIKRKTHTAKWYEDIDMIAQKYEVSAEGIIWLNELSGRKLANRQKLMIPLPGEYEEAMAQRAAADTQPADTSVAADVPGTEEEIKEEWVLFPKARVNTTLLLPLKADEETGSRNNLDFYSGVLLAVYDLAEKGISTDLNVFDIAKEDPDIPESVLSESDIIIGPVASGDVSRFLKDSSYTCPVISPLDPRVEALVSSNPRLIQAPTPHKAQYDDLVSWLKEEYQPQDTVLVITEKGARASAGMKELLNSVDSAGISCNSFSYSILEGRDIMEPVTALMTKTGTNRVLIASESEAFVNDVVRNLNVLIYNKYNVVLYGPSKIRSFETIDAVNFHNASLHVSLTYNIDYNDSRVMDFLMKYRALFNTEPSQFAFQGYDIASYFIRLCHKYGRRWPERLEIADTAMLQSTFRFRKDGDGGYVNTGVRRIIYSDGYKILIQNN